MLSFTLSTIHSTSLNLSNINTLFYLQQILISVCNMEFGNNNNNPNNSQQCFLY